MDSVWPNDFNEELNRDVIRLTADARFRAWVVSPTPESEAYWTNYILIRPDQKEAIRQARLLVLSLQMPDYSMSEEAVSSRSERLMQRIRTSPSPSVNESFNVPPLWNTFWRWAAAAVILLALSWWGFGKWNRSMPVVTALQQTGRSSLPNETRETVIEAMTANRRRRVTLPDGSVVTLAPNSVLWYTRSFGLTERVVALSGQGFFEVIRNPKKPFFVYTNSVVTRVLGTSFLVQNRAEQPATVTVRTGQVSVYKRATFSSNPAQNKALLLTPNQQAVFQVSDGMLTRSLVVKPVPLPTKTTSPTDFEDRPLTEVIDALVKTYGIPITYDREQLSQCRVTVTLEKEPFFDQLTMLCKLVEGRYEITDSSILFYSNGC